MKESKKQTYIATMALVVSIISLAVTIIMAFNEYKENIEVIPEISTLFLWTWTIRC